MNILYFDCFSGISGDMTVGALVDAGADPESIEKALKSLRFSSEYRLHWEKVVKKGITATKFIVESEKEPHGHRHLDTIIKMIDQAELTDFVKTTALRIFKIIGKAEAGIHGIPLKKVHFHEVGAVDSIIDVVATALAIEQLNPERIVSSAVAVGNGTIHIDHGIYPVPAPATIDILKGIPLKSSDIQGEMTTPTGAGIIAALAQSIGPIPDMQVERIGYGAGTKDWPNQPNVLRVMTGVAPHAG
ncbi:MAG TPA: nickel pincer cofactor biosynthesis protein LarC [Bacillales bacterium]|nr:nickel pincer cofactor biosynthesis protein LarC [Bacillales bacterium]